MEKEIKIQVPDGYEIDEKNSTFECVKFKEKQNAIKTWNDYMKVAGSPGVAIYTNPSSPIIENIFLKHLGAEIKIKLLMPYYGGEITKEEWENGGEEKYVILNHHNKIIITVCWGDYHLLVFHTKEQCENLLKYNEQLVKDYYMIDNVS